MSKSAIIETIATFTVLVDSQSPFTAGPDRGPDRIERQSRLCRHYPLTIVGAQRILRRIGYPTAIVVRVEHIKLI